MCIRDRDITYLFAASKTIRSLNVPGREIEYFEDDQLSGILEAPGKEKRSERRNRMLLILGYDAAMRVGELIDLNVENIHLDAEIPYEMCIRDRVYTLCISLCEAYAGCGS